MTAVVDGVVQCVIGVLQETQTQNDAQAQYNGTQAGQEFGGNDGS